MKYELFKTKKPSTPQHPLKKGFTIIELLIVISIMGIMGGVGFAAYSTFNGVQTLEQAALNMKSGIDEAKFSAISRVKPSACTGRVLDGYQAVICAGGNQCTNSANLYEVKAVCVAAGVATTPLTGSKLRPNSLAVNIGSIDCGPVTNNNTILFNSQTGASNTMCKIVLTENETGSTRTLCVSNGGGVFIKNTAGATCP